RWIGGSAGRAGTGVPAEQGVFVRNAETGQARRVPPSAPPGRTGVPHRAMPAVRNARTSTAPARHQPAFLTAPSPRSGTPERTGPSGNDGDGPPTPPDPQVRAGTFRDDEAVSGQSLEAANGQMPVATTRH